MIELITRVLIMGRISLTQAHRVGHGRGRHFIQLVPYPGPKTFIRSVFIYTKLLHDLHPFFIVCDYNIEGRVLEDINTTMRIQGSRLNLHLLQKIRIHSRRRIHELPVMSFFKYS